MTAVLPYVREPKDEQAYQLPCVGPYNDLMEARVTLLEHEVKRLHVLLERALRASVREIK